MLIIFNEYATYLLFLRALDLLNKFMYFLSFLVKEIKGLTMNLLANI